MLLLVAVAGACTAGDSARSGAEISTRDSAGIEIVEHALGGQPPRQVLRVSDSASVTIGRAEGEDAYLFSRVIAATRLSDGRIVVADGRSGELRYFDANGTHVQTVGRSGEGPGEFGSFSLVMRLPGDTLLVSDLRHARLTAVAPSGEIAGVTTVRPIYDRAGATMIELHGRFADGRLLGTHLPRAGRGRINGLRVDSTIYRIISLEDTTADSVARLYRDASVVSRLESGPFVEISIQSIPLTTDASRAVAPDGFYYTDGRSFTIAKYASDGALERLIRIDRAPAEVTDAIVDDAVTRATASLAAERRPAAERRMRDLPLPDSLPAFSDLRVDGGARLWAREWSIDTEAPSRWLVFGDDGRLLGAAELPAGCTVLEIGADYVLCRTRDELDVERVELRALVRVE